MAIEASVEQGYLQEREKEPITWITLEDVTVTLRPLRAKMLALFGEALTAGGIAHRIDKNELKEVMQDMDDVLHDALGCSPLYRIARDNEARNL